MPDSSPPAPLRLAVVGAGPVGLALALHAARTLPETRVALYDARPLERGVFGERPAARSALGSPWRHDYRQTAWVGQVGFEPGTSPRAPGMAFERFTRQGPAALLPLPTGRAALVWCVPQDDDPVLGLTDAQRIAVLNTIFPDAAGRLADISPLKAFALGLHAERTLTDGRTVRIGNAAQMLHPVAGQGLNLGLRDAIELVRALERGPDV